VAERTILQRSGQQWKLYVGALLMVTGVVIAARAPKVDAEPGWQLLMILGGLTLCLGAGAWQLRSVRCPRCSARWLWLAASQESAGRLLLAFALTECPVCGYPNAQRVSSLSPD
jgi:hypothetical protein